MPHAKKYPKDADVIRTYAELDEYAKSFSAEHFDLLIVVGPPGIAKTVTMRHTLGENAVWVQGSASPFGIYSLLHQNRNRPVVIDDVDGLLADRSACRMLKQLCSNEPTKTLSWITAAAGHLDPSLPKEYTTTSKVCILCNEWQSLKNANIAAVESRGHLVVFDPDPYEIHVQAAKWFWDQVVYDQIASLLPLPGLNFRHYIRASQLRDAGMDWTKVFLTLGFSQKALLAARIKTDPSYKSESERVRAFREAGGGTRSTYFLQVKKIRSKKRQSVPQIMLTAKKPHAPPELRVVSAE